jgi:hypothetical protein
MLDQQIRASQHPRKKEGESVVVPGRAFRKMSARTALSAPFLSAFFLLSGKFLLSPACP